METRMGVTVSCSVLKQCRTQTISCENSSSNDKESRRHISKEQLRRAKRGKRDATCSCASWNIKRETSKPVTADPLGDARSKPVAADPLGDARSKVPARLERLQP